MGGNGGRYVLLWEEEEGCEAGGSGACWLLLMDRQPGLLLLLSIVAMCAVRLKMAKPAVTSWAPDWIVRLE